MFPASVLDFRWNYNKFMQHISLITDWLWNMFFSRTKAEPPIYYSPKKPLEDDETLVQQHKEQAFLEWKATRREKLSLYQKQIQEQYVANVEKDMVRWQNARKTNSDMLNLQETMEKELDTHRLVHGPKKRKTPDGNKNKDKDDDVEDINVAEDDMMDVDDPGRSDETVKPEADNTSPHAEKSDQ